MGVKKSGKTHRIWISGFVVRPWSFKRAGSQKPLKNSQMSSKMPIFERFLASSSFKTSWSHHKPINSHYVGFPRFFDTNGQPEGGQIVEISLILLVFLLYLAQSTPWWNFFTHQNLAWSMHEWCMCIKWVISHIFIEFFSFFKTAIT